MFNSLRFRLILSYVIVISVCLAIIAVALALVVARNPISRELTRDRLELALQAVTRLTQADLRDGKSPTQVMADLKTRLESPDLRDLEIGGQETRVLFIAPGRRIVADSGGTLEGRELREVVVGRVQTLSTQGLVTGNINLGDKQLWIYVGRLPGTAARSAPGVLVAQAPQSVTLASPIYQSMLWQLGVAGCLGGVLAVLLAIIVAASVSRPLSKLTGAAAAIAAGDIDAQTVPAEGPAEIQELAQNFNSMMAQVRASQQSQRDFVANVSHELKTPLTSIQGFAQAIIDGAAGNPESIRHSAAIIHDEAQRMARMVSELLDTARIESGQIVMRREPVQLRAVLLNCIDNLTLNARQAGVTIETQVPNDLPVVVGDGDRLAQVLTNLLDNSLKHTPSGGKVMVAARSLSGSSIVRRGRTWPAGVEVSISDTGSGIPPEDLDRVFERFYQVDKSRPRGGGLGLGLAIAKQIVEAHYGTIRAESILGQGSRFVVTLPLDPGTETTQASARKH